MCGNGATVAALPKPFHGVWQILYRANAEISSLVVRGVKLSLDEELVESKYLLCKRSIRHGTTRANLFSIGASLE